MSEAIEKFFNTMVIEFDSPMLEGHIDSYQEEWLRTYMEFYIKGVANE